jgi:glucosamine--fructose-6-phosphate aminotransferase (isomerizing)
MPAIRSGHPYHMHDAIYAQPGALRLVTRGQDAALATVAGAVAAAPAVWLSGVGSSWHAALIGAHLLAGVGGLGARVRAVHAADLTRYGPEPAPGTAIVVVSHRGTARAPREAVARGAAAGAVTIAVTGKGAALAGAAHALHTVEPEASGCHTVSYTTALALLAALAVAVGGDDEARGQLEALPDQVALLLGQEAWENLAGRFHGRRRYWFVGGGPQAATAHEAALKAGEAAWVTATGLEVEEFLHGPWAALTADDLLVLIAPPGPSHARCADAARVAAALGAPVLALVEEDDPEIGPLAAETIALPAVGETLGAIPAVVPLQLLAYHLAVRAGANPDTTRAEQPAYARARAAAAP